jgi:hypothetical protein
MAKPKKEEEVIEVVETSIPNKIEHLSVDYPNEGLNNLARKINEIIDHLYGN